MEKLPGKTWIIQGVTYLGFSCVFLITWVQRQAAGILIRRGCGGGSTDR